MPRNASASQRRDLYGVNSGTGRSGKVLRRALKLPDDASTISDSVVAAAHANDPKRLIVAICEERLRFLQSLKTWLVFGAGWRRRVAEVRSTALAMAASSSAPAVSQVSVPGRAVVPVARGPQQASAGAIAMAGAAAVHEGHQSGMRLAVLTAIAVLTVVLASCAWLFWHWRQRCRQERPV
jgi:lysozyme family protein